MTETETIEDVREQLEFAIEGLVLIKEALALPDEPEDVLDPPRYAAEIRRLKGGVKNA